MFDGPPPPPTAAELQAMGVTLAAVPAKTGPVVGDDVPLAAEQQAAVQRLLTTDAPVTLLTGLAGAGKSTVTSHIQRDPRLVAALGGMVTCATTGKAALTAGTRWTVDALFGMNRDTWECNLRKAEANLAGARTVFIDEGSMVGKKMLGCLYSAALVLGVRLVEVGDWAQAKPVKDDWPTIGAILQTGNVIKLTECHRQSDRAFLAALNEVRRAEVSGAAEALFRGRLMAKPPEGPGWVRMYATNADADKFNMRMLNELCGKRNLDPFRLTAGWKDMRPDDVQTKFPLDEKMVKNKLRDSSLANGEMFVLGAQVMLTANAPMRDGERPYANGDVGTIIDIIAKPNSDPGSRLRTVADGTFPYPPPKNEIQKFIVLLDRNGEAVEVYSKNINIEDSKKRPMYSMFGFPMQLGWAATIHKSQGVTVDKAWLDMSSIRKIPEEGRHGLAYVGLSRTRTLEGLAISGWLPEAVRCDREVLPLI